MKSDLYEVRHYVLVHLMTLPELRASLLEGLAILRHDNKGKYLQVHVGLGSR